ncbi:3'-5' exonuclease [Venturia nashicola]|uniref:3'-5' exonuclease n=1 Tax=Venturia nashicola TaxID=86259 RepID=A0A4Z1P178_9PEZI|nr:3'-5' exonuclease [Venturia nashicola]
MASDQQPFSWNDALIAEDEVETPIRITDRLAYHIPGHKLQELQARPQATTYWSHKWYRDFNGKKVKISYASTREQSEELAKRFLKERVLGFDMEWKAGFTRKNTKRGNKRKNSRTIKDEISLIQVASADEIGLFHIALHKGTRPVELIARSLREIIESNAIIKTGVGIYSADAARLQSHMKFQPRGMLDLNHLHRLVDISSGRRMLGLSEHARIYLGFPLFKGKVRTSDWTKPLTTAQQNYAASDAYVGLVLYHVLDVRRLNMDPIPPHPETDKNPSPKNPTGDAKPQPAQQTCPSIVSEPMPRAQVDRQRNVGRESDTLASPFNLSPRHSTAIEPARCATVLPTPVTTLPQTPLPLNEERRLLANLHSLRFRLQRSTGFFLESIAGEETLIKIVKQRPETVPALCRVPGAGKLYQLCKTQNINLLDCITTPPKSISFDSSLSLVNLKAAKTLQPQASAAVSHTASTQNATSSKKRRRSCSFSRDGELASVSSVDSIATATKQGCTAQDPISIPSSPVFFETIDIARDRRPGKDPKRDALTELPIVKNAQLFQLCKSPSSGKPNSTTEDACARRDQPGGCSLSHRAGTDEPLRKDSDKPEPNLPNSVLPKPPLVHLDLTSHTDDRGYRGS